MPLFQSTVVTKYLKSLDASEVDNKWKLFTDHFQNTQIQENIRNSKEEQYQEGFLRDLFVKVLGYTLNPENNFNLTTEYKNVKDSKKADGAIILGDKVRAVIELKGTETTDLTKVESQAFGYKNNQPDCTYIMSSNFEKLRFYIDNAIEHMEFNLFTLTKQEFQLLYLSLAYENLEKDIPKKIKEESVSQEDAITKKLYNDYSLFKRELHQSLVVLNPQYDALTLFQKSQKLLDRFLFLFFAEDRQLLPPNSVRLILEQWIKLKDLDAYIPLFDRFKKYFGYLNTGFKGKQYDVYAYNGGLFKTDTVLDAIVIDDDLLYKHALKLSEYDFNSEVDVNILGHIFENSLNEIEEIQAQLEGQDIDRSKSKRKKDGVFYTPKYITKYIVENTVGKLCEEKKAELEIAEAEFTTDKKRQQKTRKGLLDKLTAYRNWLLQITICDPACGSGAFLNQALDFLIKEHRYIDELQAKLFGDAMVLSDVEKSILENNLFGVDINEESVEIAKLSLWLRTAQPNRKLNDLSNNIKCGNSLIDDPAVAGEKAFNWQKEFPRVFKEKDKKAFHITTATHDSRTSQRMIDYKVRETRDEGLRPKAEPIWLEQEDEILISKTIFEIIKEDGLNVMAYNICGDHLHLLLVCEEEEVPKIVGKIKGKTSRIYNSNKGINPLVQKGEEKSVSLWTQKFGCKEIKDEKQLWNTVEYIRTNRGKHKMPPLDINKEINKGINPLVEIENALFYSSYDHAFRTEYKGGFDVVIGNPPYVRPRSLTEIKKEFIINNYKTAENQFDLYHIFIEKCEGLRNKKGIVSLILPNAFLANENSKLLRKYILENCHIQQIIDCKQDVFKDASVEVLIYVFDSNSKISKYFELKNNFFDYKHDFLASNFLNNKNYNFTPTLSLDAVKLFQKVNAKSRRLEEEFDIMSGIKEYQTGKGKPPQIAQDKELRRFNANYKKDDSYVKEIRGKHVQKYSLEWEQEYISYGIWLAEPRNPNYFKGERFLMRQIPSKNSLVTCFTNIEYVVDQSAYVIKPKDDIKINKGLLGILNSKLIFWYYRNENNEFDNLFPKIKAKEIRNLPIISGDYSCLNEKVIQVETNTNELRKLSNILLKLIISKFEIEKLTNKLQNWHDLEFGDFLKELEKARKQSATAATRGFIPLAKQEYTPLSLSEQAEWMQYFNEQKQKAQTLKSEIDKIDKEIDQMVYELYGLNQEEREIVENS